MRWNQIEGNWKPFEGYESEDKPTHVVSKQLAGKREILLGKLQEGLGVAQDKAEERSRDFGKIVSDSFLIF